jgi:hypothetical protein
MREFVVVIREDGQSLQEELNRLGSAGYSVDAMTVMPAKPPEGIDLDGEPASIVVVLSRVNPGIA